MPIKQLKIFDAEIEYDADKQYGLVNSQGTYGLLPVESTIHRLIINRSQQEFVELLSSQVEELEFCLGKSKIIEELIAEDILKMFGKPKKNIERYANQEQQLVQNTINLFKNIISAL